MGNTIILYGKCIEQRRHHIQTDDWELFYYFSTTVRVDGHRGKKTGVAVNIFGLYTYHR